MAADDEGTDADGDVELDEESEYVPAEADQEDDADEYVADEWAVDEEMAADADSVEHVVVAAESEVVVADVEGPAHDDYPAEMLALAAATDDADEPVPSDQDQFEFEDRLADLLNRVEAIGASRPAATLSRKATNLWQRPRSRS